MIIIAKGCLKLQRIYMQENKLVSTCHDYFFPLHFDCQSFLISVFLLNNYFLASNCLKMLSNCDNSDSTGIAQKMCQKASGANGISGTYQLWFSHGIPRLRDVRFV